MGNFKRLAAVVLVVVMVLASEVTTFANADYERCELTEAVQAGKNLSVILRMFPDLDEEYIQSAFEQEVIRLANEIRYEYGLPALIYHPELARIARLRAEETVRYSSRGHISPTTGLQHAEHARAMGLDVRRAGENWTGGRSSPANAVESWMNSPGHRRFILSGLESHFGGYKYIGVGFAITDCDIIPRGPFTLWQMVEPGS